MNKERVLVVDDDQDFRDLMKMILEECDFEALTATSGQETLDMLQREKVDVCAVLLDINMPEMNGMEVAKRLKESESTKHLHIELVTVWDEGGLKRKFPGIEKYYDGYTQKPLDIERICKLIKTISRSKG